MADITDGKARNGEAQGARRSRQPGRRQSRVEFALTEEEFRLLEEAAGQAGLARGAYAAEAAMAAAAGTATCVICRSGMR